MPDFSCIITAGGSSLRFGDKEKKQFYKINDKPIINYTIELFYEIKDINEIIITLPIDDFEAAAQKLMNNFPEKIKCILGKDTRQKSVYNAIQICDMSNKYVMIHDAVRPYVNISDINSMIELTKNHNAVIPGAKVKNTIKKIEINKIIETINRDDLIEVYTPQMFKLDLIKDYHEKAKFIDKIFTDDASILEHFNIPVYWHETDSSNIKITTKDDIDFLQFLLNKKRML